MKESPSVCPYVLEVKTARRIEAFSSCVPDEYPLHSHDYYEFELVTQGSGRQWINNECQAISPGSLYLITPNDVHRLKADEALHFISIHFLGDLISQFHLPEQRQAMIARLTGDDYTLIHALLERALTISEQDHSYAEQQLAGLIAFLLSDLLQRGTPLQSPLLAPPIRRALHFIQENAHQPSLQLRQAAQACGLSPCYFSSLFKHSVGYGFSEYLTRRRLHHAAMLLTTQPLSITEIAYQTGFSSLPHFFRSFRRFYGRTPAEYRKERG